MIKYTFEVPGNPRGKGRPRTRVVSGGGKAFAHVYTDAKTAAYENLVALAAQQAGVTPIEGAVEIKIDLYFARPKRLLRAKDPDGLIPHASKPDADNVAKAILDGLSPFIRDEAVTYLRIAKWYVAKGGEPHASVMLREAV